jgi:hypothetical protein
MHGFKSDWDKIKESMETKGIINYLEYSLELIKIIYQEMFQSYQQG